MTPEIEQAFANIELYITQLRQFQIAGGIWLQPPDLRKLEIALTHLLTVAKGAAFSQRAGEEAIAQYNSVVTGFNALIQQGNDQEALEFIKRSFAPVDLQQIRSDFDDVVEQAGGDDDEILRLLQERNS